MPKIKNKKAKKDRALEKPIDTVYTEESPKIDYHRPLSSPYEAPLLTLVIGNTHYGLPESFLEKYPQFPRKSTWDSTVTLQDVHEDAGHSLVHFLYSGNYETINLPLNEGKSDIAREYRKSILVHQASRKYGLGPLEDLALQYIQRFGNELSLPEILWETSDVFSEVLEGETWFPNYIKERLQRMLDLYDRTWVLNELYNSLGHNSQFDNIVLKMVVEILSVRLDSLSKDEDEVPNEEVVCEEEAPPEDEVLREEVVEHVVYEEVVHEDEAPAEIPPPDEVQDAQASTVKVSTADLALYYDWDHLAPLIRRRRIRELGSRGLPTPNEDGSISIFVA